MMIYTYPLGLLHTSSSIFVNLKLIMFSFYILVIPNIYNTLKTALNVQLNLK